MNGLSRPFADVTKTLSVMVPDTRLWHLYNGWSPPISRWSMPAYYTDDECIERIADWIAGWVRSEEVEDAPILMRSDWRANFPHRQSSRNRVTRLDAGSEFALGH